MAWKSQAVRLCLCLVPHWIFVKVHTDEGITGVGEGTLEHREYAFMGVPGPVENNCIIPHQRHIFSQLLTS